MKKSKLESIIDRLNCLLEENPRLLYIDCADKFTVIKCLVKLKSKKKAYIRLLGHLASEMN